jgi:hypothetical protein
MADTVKKAKAPAKPRKTATKKEKIVTEEKIVAAPEAVMPSREEIEKLAQKYWAQRGYQDGFAEQDWLLAERTLMQKAS